MTGSDTNVAVRLEFSRQDWMPFSALIRWATWSKWSHVDVIMPNCDFIGARGSGGVIRHAEPKPASKKQVYVVYMPQHKANAFYRAIESQVGKPYDWLGIFGYALRKDWETHNAWFCSELVAWAFNQADFPLINAKKSRVTPRDLTLSPFISEYHNG